MEVIPEQWAGSLPAKDGRFKRRQEGWRKRTLNAKSHVGDEKDKRAIVYKTKEKEEKRIRPKKIIKACLKKLMTENYAYSFSCFTLKSNILAQDSD